MRQLAAILAAGVVLLVCSGGILASEQADVDIQVLGKQLVVELWHDFETADAEAIEGYISPAFQSVHQDGARGAAAEIEVVKNLSLGEYTLSDFHVSQAGPVLIVTYLVSASETIAGETLPTAPAARLSAFLQTGDGWEWICHANLNPMS
jgi:hypothetical protein